jgi:hypothetical protein
MVDGERQTMKNLSGKMYDPVSYGLPLDSPSRHKIRTGFQREFKTALNSTSRQYGFRAKRQELIHALTRLY